MKLSTTSRFQRFDLTAQEEGFAKQVNPYFFALLQNKIASYADAVVEFSYEGQDLTTAMLEHERLKAQVVVLEELMEELVPPSEATDQPANQQ